jgi:hypothetical protein
MDVKTFTIHTNYDKDSKYIRIEIENRDKNSKI